MKIIEITEDSVTFLVNGQREVYERDSQTITIPLEFLQEFDGFEESNICTECNGDGYYETQELNPYTMGCNYVKHKCECQPIIKI